jgi:hypothetical protein
MKFATLRLLVVLIAIAVLTVFAIRAFAQGAPRPVPSERSITLKFKDAELKDEAALRTR